MFFQSSLDFLFAGLIGVIDSFLYFYIILFRIHNLPGNCTCRCCSRTCKINLYLRCSHTSKEISVIRCYNAFSVRKDSSCSSATQSAARMCDDRTCFCQNIQRSVCQCLSVDLTACRCNNQLHKVRNFLSFEYFCCSSEIFQTTICTGPDKYLVDFCSL